MFLCVMQKTYQKPLVIHIANLQKYFEVKKQKIKKKHNYCFCI